MIPRGGVRHGNHAQFAALYEDYLDWIYPKRSRVDRGGRWRLMRSVAAEMRDRGVRTVLDCAAGTGFPSLDLAAEAPEPLTIHCSDGDLAMVSILTTRARSLGLAQDDLAPPRWPRVPRVTGLRKLLLDWKDLHQIRHSYDYVLCRGNSLAYADTWTGSSDVPAELTIEHYLTRMADRLRPGGYLHVDAPWHLELPPSDDSTPTTGTGTFWERVTTDGDCREWWLSFKPSGTESPTVFKRYSSLVTIDRVEAVMKAIGFDDTAPFQLTAERASFGTIIARRPARGRIGFSHGEAGR